MAQDDLRVNDCVAPRNSLSRVHVSPMMLHEYSLDTLSPMSTSVSSFWTHPGAPPQSQERRAFILAGRSHEMRTMAQWPLQTISQVRSPTCSTFLIIFRSYFQSSKSPGRVETSTKSTTLASTERSPAMLNLTTCTSEKRLLHPCSHRRTQSGTNLSLD